VYYYDEIQTLGPETQLTPPHLDLLDAIGSKLQYSSFGLTPEKMRLEHQDQSHLTSFA
jgi:hypothetical protein